MTLAKIQAIVTGYAGKAQKFLDVLSNSSTIYDNISEIEAEMINSQGRYLDENATKTPGDIYTIAEKDYNEGVNSFIYIDNEIGNLTIFDEVIFREQDEANIILSGYYRRETPLLIENGLTITKVGADDKFNIVFNVTELDPLFTFFIIPVYKEQTYTPDGPPIVRVIKSISNVSMDGFTVEFKQGDNLSIDMVENFKVLIMRGN